jgi:hypothetical protein
MLSARVILQRDWEADGSPAPERPIGRASARNRRIALFPLIGAEISLMCRLDSLLAVENSLFSRVGNLLSKSTTRLAFQSAV